MWQQSSIDMRVLILQIVSTYFLCRCRVMRPVTGMEPAESSASSLMIRLIREREPGMPR